MKKGKDRTQTCVPNAYMKLVLPEDTKKDYGIRPHGGFKGVPGHYPPSKSAFLTGKPVDFLHDVKNMVFRQMQEERELAASPQWINKYNTEQNHTGEQPLMVQRFLSNNKQEQQDGVLPAAHKQHARFRIEGDGSQEFHQGLSLHQYLTATEMPGQSEKLVDLKHGRPTRTSLLRARQRSRSAPGPEKPKLEIRNDLHFLQDQTLKREEKYKSVDVPEELQPLTESGESVHQFLVGARYNRAYYRDSKCFNQIGLYVSRDNPQHCFLKPGVDQQSLLGRKADGGNTNAGAFSEVTMSELNSLCQSTSSMQSKVHSLHPPIKAQPAWGTANPIVNSAPSPTPNDSRESFAFRESFVSKGEPEHESQGIEGSGVLQTRRLQLRSAPHRRSSSPKPPKSATDSCDSCLLCQEGASVKKGMPVHYHGRNIMSAPNRRKWTHGVNLSRITDHDQCNSRGRNVGRKNDADLMLIQQYHLRILGTQMNMRDGKNLVPKGKVHFTPWKTTGMRANSAKPASSHSRVNRNNNHSSSSAQESIAEDVKNEVSSITKSASRISVHISTSGDGDEDGEVEPTPRSQDVTVGSPRDIDANNNLLQQEEAKVSDADARDEEMGMGATSAMAEDVGEGMLEPGGDETICNKEDGVEVVEAKDGEVNDDETYLQEGKRLGEGEEIDEGTTIAKAEEDPEGGASGQGGDDVVHEKDDTKVLCDDNQRESDVVQLEEKVGDLQMEDVREGDAVRDLDEEPGGDADHDAKADCQVGAQNDSTSGQLIGDDNYK